MKRIFLSLLFLVACASSGGRTVERLEAPSVITVENERTDDATIYIQRAGVRSRRLGKVTSLSSDTFLLSESDGALGTDIQFVAISFASGAVDISDPVTLDRSTQYHWSLGPARGHQFISQRSAE